MNAPRPAGPSVSFEDRMATVEFRVAPDGPHHRRRRLVPRLHDPGVRGGVPGQPVRADGRRRHPLQLRAVLRVRHVLPRVQRRGRHHVDLPRGRPRRGVPEPRRDRRRLPEVGRPATRGRPAHRGGAPRRPHRRRCPTPTRPRSSGRCGPARRGASRSWPSPPGPPAADAVLREALAAGATGAVRVDLAADAPSEAVAAALAAAPGRRAASCWCGDLSADRGSGSVPAYLAARLGAAQALGLVAVELGPPGSIAALRRLDGGRRERLRRARAGRLLGRGLHRPPAPGAAGRRAGRPPRRRSPAHAGPAVAGADGHAPVRARTGPAPARCRRPTATTLDRVARSSPPAPRTRTHGQPEVLEPAAAAAARARRADGLATPGRALTARAVAFGR